MFKQKKFTYEILEKIQKNIIDDIERSDTNIFRYNEKLSEISKEDNPWDWECYNNYIDDEETRIKAARDILKQLEKIYG